MEGSLIKNLLDVEKYLVDNNLEICHIRQTPYRIRDDFFHAENDLFRGDECPFENIEIDYKGWLARDYSLSDDCIPINVPFLEEAVREYFDNNLDEFCYLPAEMVDADVLANSFLSVRFGDIKIMLPPLMEHIENVISNMEYWELEPHFYNLYGEYELDLGEMLDYWTIYFSPEVDDEEVAWEVGLYPFYYRDELYLALGGCGMNLSPLLDAYQALTVGSVPSGSCFIRDAQYAQYLVGKGVFDKVMKAIARPPVITICTTPKGGE